MHDLNSLAPPKPMGITFYDQYAPTIYAYIYRKVSSAQDAEDLLLEVFLAASQNNNLNTLNDQERIAWLQRVAHNKVIDRYRRSRNISLVSLDQMTEQTAELPDQDLTPEDLVLQKETYEQLYQALNQLSPRQREIIRLRFGNRLRLTEIAKMLKKPAGTVRVDLSRALRHLRAIYEKK